MVQILSRELTLEVEPKSMAVANLEPLVSAPWSNWPRPDRQRAEKIIGRQREIRATAANLRKIARGRTSCQVPGEFCSVRGDMAGGCRYVSGGGQRVDPLLREGKAKRGRVMTRFKMLACVACVATIVGCAPHAAGP